MQLALRNVCKKFGQQIIFDSLNFEFNNCGLYLICSKSGEGKTTLLNILAGYESFDRGERLISEDVDIVCIFQNYELVEALNVKENILMFKEISGEEDLYYEMLIDKLQLKHLLLHFPKELSHGQKERVGIARALLKKPKLIICDEPTESLDSENKFAVMALLKELSKNSIVIVASHDVATMKGFYDCRYDIENKRLVCIEDHKGRMNIVNTEKSKEFNKKKAKRYIHKIIRKKSVLFTGILCSLLLLQLILFQITHIVFEEKDKLHALNKDMIYLELYDEKQKESLLTKYTTMLPILKFDNLQIKGKVIHAYTFPLLNGNIKGNHLIINQNMGQLLREALHCDQDSLIGKKLILQYELEDRWYPVEMIIKEMIVEDDVKVAQMYYSYEYLNQLMRQKDFRDGMTQYDYFFNNATQYSLKSSTNAVSNLYTKLSEDTMLKVFHSIYSTKDDLASQKQLYKFVFIAIQGILLLITTVYLFFYAKKDTEKNLQSMTLVYVAGVPISYIKKCYMKIKSIYLSFFVVLLLIEIMGFYYFNRTGLPLMIGYVLFTCVVYLFLLILELYKFDLNKIAMILKRDKD